MIGLIVLTNYYSSLTVLPKTQPNAALPSVWQSLNRLDKEMRFSDNYCGGIASDSYRPPQSR